jgi:hypothetical protein
MFGCLTSQTGFQNAREVQGAFFLNFAKVFRFSAKNRQLYKWQGENSFTTRQHLETFYWFSDAIKLQPLDVQVVELSQSVANHDFSEII